MRYKFYSQTTQSWEGMLKAIEEARYSIYWENYILKNDTHPVFNFFHLLKKKAGAGVKIKIILDRFGSADLPQKEKQDLEEAGVELLYFDFWFRRTHRKILVVDGKIGFLGGVNVGKLYNRWLDLHIRLEGKIVRYLLSSFAKTYKICGGRDQEVLKFKVIRSIRSESHKVYKVSRVKHWFLEHWPIKGKDKLRKHYGERLNQASRSIVIVTPYFIPHKWFIKCLEQALSRGVAIEIIIPKKTDYALADFANYLFMDSLRHSGIHFFLTQEMLHAKALLIDDREGMIGSQNIDALSFDFNVEAGIFFQRKDMVNSLKKILDGWKKESFSLENVTFKKRWYHYILEPVAHLLRPFL